MENVKSNHINNDWWFTDSYIPEHPHLNTFIIMDDYKSDKEIDYSDGRTFDLSKINKNNYDTHIIFIVTNIEENNNILNITGDIGLWNDPKYDIKLIYDMNENKIYISSYYRLLYELDEHKLFINTFDAPHDKIWKYENGKLVEINVPEHVLDLDDDSIPYYRFPRSKDGISIPRVIFNTFKVFSDEKAIKPKIIIPSNWDVYSSWSCTGL